MTLWGGRFAAATDEWMRRFNDSIGFDRRMHEADIRGSVAYAGALARADLITSEEHSFLTGTTVREIASLEGDVSSMVPPLVNKALKKRFKELGEDGPKAFPLTSLRD